MDKELKYIEGEPFHYQIGEVTTILPWWRPNYDRISKFLVQPDVEIVLNKYRDVQIIGNCLWDFDVTWDLDMRLILPNKSIDWNEVEDDLNKLNHLALNEWRILLDIGVTDEHHTLPMKSDIIRLIERGEKVPLSERYLAKICYAKKVIGSEYFENDIRNILEYECQPLTDRYLVAYSPKFHKPKILNRILNSKKEILENSISIQDFLNMGEEEFLKFQNY